MRARSCVLVALAAAVASWMLGPSLAEASFPGQNGLIAFPREGPPFNKARNPEGAWTIWVVNPRSGRTRQLTHVPARCGRRGWTWGDGEPSYSASGRLLTYSHIDSCDPRTKDGIYVMRADGSRRRLIREMTADPDDIPEYPVFFSLGRVLGLRSVPGRHVHQARRAASS